MRSRVLLLALVATSLLAVGCRNRMRRDPPRGGPPPASIAIPPQRIPVEGDPPMPGVPRGVAPDPAAELLLPEDAPKQKSDYPRIVPPARGAILDEPIAAEKPAEAAKPGEPTGIADFALVKDGVHTGKRPEIDGLDWLKANGYKTVVNLRNDGDDDTTDRRQVEARGMTYIGLPVSPEKMTLPWLDEFNRVIGDAAGRPVFVYGRDEAATSAVWYLHLRSVEFLTHDEARVRAGRLGLRDEKSPMFEAVLKLLPAN